ncbi:hypothetical protein ACFXTH_001815 [Malus domestica]
MWSLSCKCPTVKTFGTKVQQYMIGPHFRVLGKQTQVLYHLISNQIKFAAAAPPLLRRFHVQRPLQSSPPAGRAAVCELTLPIKDLSFLEIPSVLVFGIGLTASF